MTRTARTLAALASSAALAALAVPAAPAGELGGHVAGCAQEHLGQRDGAPAVTCTHDGMTMTFPTFGAMVLHMQQHHG